MKSTRIKWEQAMAQRCLARVNRFNFELEPVLEEVSADLETPPAPVLVDIDIKAGEWDSFEYALSAALKR